MLAAKLKVLRLARHEMNCILLLYALTMTFMAIFDKGPFAKAKNVRSEKIKYFKSRTWPRPRCELQSLGGMLTSSFTPIGQHYLLFTKTEGQIENLRP
jgi:hypothetical protein